MRWCLVRVCSLMLLLMAGCGAPPPAAQVDQAALAQVRGLRATGIVVDPIDGANRRLVIEAAAPALYRQRETSAATRGPGIRQLIGYNGTVGWRAGNTQLAGDGLSDDADLRDRAITAASRQNYINFMAGVMPSWLREAGLTLRDIGTLPDGEDRGSTAVTISQDGTDLGRLVFDATTNLPRRLVVSYLRSIRPEGGEYRISFSDYRDVGQGVQLPHVISREQGGMTVQWIISAYQLNPGFPAGTFEVPGR